MLKKQIKEYSNIIWDWNGTLLNDVHLCADIMNGLLSKRNLPVITVDRYREIFTFPVKDYYISAGHSFENESFEKIGMEFIVEYEKRKSICSLYPFAEDVLKRMKSLNMKQYLLSAYKLESLIEIIEKYGISDYFLSIKGLDHVYADGKLEQGRQLMSEISVNGDKESVLLIGDTVHDFEVADELGIDCLLISEGHQDEKKLMNIGIPVIKNMGSLYVLLN